MARIRSGFLCSISQKKSTEACHTRSECFSSGGGCDWRKTPEAELMSLAVLVRVSVAAGKVSLNSAPVKAEGHR